jgi:hypothetical protein
MRPQPGAADVWARRLRGRKTPQLAVLTLAIAIAAPLSASAEDATQLPVFKTCSPATVPELPKRWHAVGLLMPFQLGQIDVGEFDYDGALPAMRASVYGLKSGAVDLLITRNDTYVVEGPHSHPTGCTSVGAKLRPPSPQWLMSDAICAGETPVAGEDVQWWQQPGFDVARYWFTTKSRLPWRTSYLNRSFDPAIIGDYAMTYFAQFAPAAKTDLAALQKFCEAKAKPGTQAIGATPTARELMALANGDAETEREARIEKLIPGLSNKSCAAMTAAQWPDRFIMSAIITPIKIDDTPYPTFIYYDWAGSRTMVVLPFHSHPPLLQGILSLKSRVGYRLHFVNAASQVGACQANLPGAVKPDWMQQAGCECQAVLAANSALSPGTETQILSCPIKHQAPRVMWTWYTAQGRPLMFMEAAPESGGVMLADYYEWLPGQTARPAEFDLPNACQALDKSGGSAEANGPSFSHPSCSDCHSTQW